MTTPGRGSRATATGLALMTIAAGVGVSSFTDGFALLLSFAGVLAGASLIFVGVRVADDPTTPIGRAGVLSARVRALLLHCLHPLVGFLLASVAASATGAAADREAAPVLCFCAFCLLLLGLSLLNVRVLLGEQEH